MTSKGRLYFQIRKTSASLFSSNSKKESQGLTFCEIYMTGLKDIYTHPVFLACTVFLLNRQSAVWKDIALKEWVVFLKQIQLFLNLGALKTNNSKISFRSVLFSMFYMLCLNMHITSAIGELNEADICLPWCLAVYIMNALFSALFYATAVPQWMLVSIPAPFISMLLGRLFLMPILSTLSLVLLFY